MKEMSVTRDVNLGTLLPVIVFMVGQTVAFVAWVVHENSQKAIQAAVVTQQLSEMRDWQNRQDDRIALTVQRQQDIIQQQTSIVTLLEFFKSEWEDRRNR